MIWLKFDAIAPKCNHPVEETGGVRNMGPIADDIDFAPILLLSFLAQPLKVFSGTGKEEIVSVDYPLEASSSISEMTRIGGTLC